MRGNYIPTTVAIIWFMVAFLLFRYGIVPFLVLLGSCTGTVFIAIKIGSFFFNPCWETINREYRVSRDFHAVFLTVIGIIFAILPVFAVKDYTIVMGIVLLLQLFAYYLLLYYAEH